MFRSPTETTIPIYSRLSYHLHDADYRNAWGVQLVDTRESAFALLTQAVQQAPRWIELCMSLRNQVARHMGQRALGSMAQLAEAPPIQHVPEGTRIGIFTLLENQPDEVLLSCEDRHLRVLFSLHRQPMPDGNTVIVTFSTGAKLYDRLGQWHMRAVHPLHQRIVPALLNRLLPVTSALDRHLQAAES